MNKNRDKTNVMRILDQKKINYKYYDYTNTDAISEIEVVNVLNQDPNTVVTVRKNKI